MKDYLKPLAMIVTFQAKESMMNVDVGDDDVGTSESLGDW